MNHSDNTVMAVNAITSRVTRKLGLYHVTFSATGAASCVHGKMCPFTTNSVSSSITNATGRKAT